MEVQSAYAFSLMMTGAEWVRCRAELLQLSTESCPCFAGRGNSNERDGCSEGQGLRRRMFYNSRACSEPKIRRFSCRKLCLMREGEAVAARLVEGGKERGEGADLTICYFH